MEGGKEEEKGRRRKGRGVGREGVGSREMEEGEREEKKARKYLFSFSSRLVRLTRAGTFT